MLMLHLHSYVTREEPGTEASLSKGDETLCPYNLNY